MAVVTPAAPAATEEDKELLISGSEAVAEALTLADLDVVTAYPIRPYDTVMQAIAKKISGGQLVAEYIVAEGEHSQFEIVKHASTVGARVFCGSSGVGWMYAMECLVVTPPLRVPMVALVGNRALDDPGAFGVEHNDALVVRDVGWMLCWIDTSQEALDTTLIAYRVAEDRRVFLPLASSADGAFLTHSQALTMVPPKSKVDRFLPRYDRGDLQLHPDNPITVAPQANEDWVIEIRRQNNEAMGRAVTVIEEAYADFRRVFGRGPENPWFEEYMSDDADVILVGMGTISLPIKVAIRELRAKGKKVGLVRLRWFRPFPTEKLVAALSKAKAVGIIDRNYSFGSPFGSGVVANEIRAALYNADRRPPLLSFICGLGGREGTLEDVYKAVDLRHGAAAGLKALMKKGKMKSEPINVIAFCGDGGGADMGLGAISATLTHKEYNSLILLYDNESYANTDIQLSGMTPYGANTTFSPPGKVKRLIHTRWKKNMAGMLAAGHPECRYVATVCASYAVEMMNKVRRALTIGGPTFIHSLDPCPKGWDYDPMLSHELGELAIETGIFPLYEVEDGVVKYYGKTKAIVEGRRSKPVREYLLKQGRFAHFTEEDLSYFQEKVDEQWDKWQIPGVVPFRKLDAAQAALNAK